ncbi:DUF1513 domain-containing protein [Arenibaculum pallidiluteum]|uniref:DUF1513 domain-containing protein n=1 Tax=Arenibaculum pallidiluteum TaxID=2812559 RepID=UPI001F37CD14|nr:DUF1513 domain-containing protein [Arenibaculum pallidiluteum]
MEIHRRTFLAAFGGVLAQLAAGPVAASAGGRHLFLTAFATAPGRPVGYGVAALDAAGRVAFALPLPGRAHGVVPHPRRAQAVVFERRPGRWFVPVDLATAALGKPVEVPAGRSFTGHGAFGPDGRLLYVAEDDVERETGSIGVYDAADGYRRCGALPTHGIGPHELIMLDGGRVLAVANGGIITHPETGRAKLNTDGPDSSLTYVDASTGRLIEAVRLPEGHSNLGIRHLAEVAGGGVVLGMQDERPTGEVQALVAVHRLGSPARMLAAPEDELARFRGYVGSVAAGAGGALVAASSPRGGLIGVWDAGTGAWVGSLPLADGCGLAAEGAGFLASSGHGRLLAVAGKGGGEEAGTDLCVEGNLRLDNHLTPWAGGAV